MDDLIRRQEAIDLFLAEGMITAAIYVERMPSAQPERNKGRWKPFYHGGTSFTYRCSDKTNFCPNCGARMEAKYE